MLKHEVGVQALDVDDRDRFIMVFEDVWQALKGTKSLSAYMALKRRANDDRKEWFGTYSVLSKEAGMSPKTFQRCIEHLESLGLVVSIRRFAPKGWDRKDESKLVYGEKTHKSQEEIGKLYRIRFHLPVGNSDQRGGGKSDQTPPCNSDQRGGGKSDHQTYIPSDVDTSDVYSSSVDEPGQPDGFKDFWDNYPRKIGKGKAEEKYKEQLQATTPDVLVNAVRNFAAECRIQQTEKRYIPYPSTWLNQGRWKDYDVAPPAQDTSRQETPDFDMDQILSLIQGGEK